MDTNEQLAGQILDLLHQLSLLHQAGSRTWDRQRRLYRKLRRMQQQLGAEFGDRFGWRLSRRRFAIGKLCQVCVGEPCDWWNGPTYSTCYFDHPYYYRHPERPCRPAGIAAHLYGGFSDKVGVLASRLDIIAEPVSDFPSFWYPGVTTLVVYRPRRILAINPCGEPNGQ